MTVFGVILFILAPTLMPLFIDDAQAIEIGSRALRIEALVMPLLTTNVMCNMTFQSMGQRFKASFLSSLRQGLYFIPCVFILPAIWGLTGVEMIFPASDILTFLTSLPFAIHFLFVLNKKIHTPKTDEE